MKTWNTPEIAELDVACTEQGRDMAKDWDEIRVDQNGEFWVSFQSGGDSNPEPVGPITVK